MNLLNDRLKFQPGVFVTVLNEIQRHTEYGWESSHEEETGVYHSHDINGAWVQVEQGDRVRLVQYPFNLVYIKLKKDNE